MSRFLIVIGLLVVALLLTFVVASLLSRWPSRHGSRFPEDFPDGWKRVDDGIHENGVYVKRDGDFVDAHGFPYARYLVLDDGYRQRYGYRRVIPTTYRYSCPDCGGSVVGVDTPRVNPGGKGPLPTAYRCESCGRLEERDFAVPRVEMREDDLTYEEPEGLHQA